MLTFETHGKAVIARLNYLRRMCIDGQIAYQHAQEGTRSAELAAIFAMYQAQRELFAQELITLVDSRAEWPVAFNEKTATFHHAWHLIRAAVTCGDDVTILEECERSEQCTCAAYQDALQLALPLPTRQVLQRQYAHLRDAHANMLSLYDAYRR